MGSTTRAIGRNKARNLKATEQAGRGTFKTKDGRTVKKFTGGAVIYPVWLRDILTAKAKKQQRTLENRSGTQRRRHIFKLMEKRRRANSLAKISRKANR